jgi:hypothetical protein
MRAVASQNRSSFSICLAQPRLRRRRPVPAANQLVIFPRLFNAGQVVPQVPVPLTRAKDGREVFSQLISRERQICVMKHISHTPTVGPPRR